MDYFSNLFNTVNRDGIETFVAGEDFLRILMNNAELRRIVLQGQFHICCPCSSSILGSTMGKKDVMDHILMKGKQPGEYKSINGKSCSIVGNHFVLQDGFGSRSRRVRIISTSFRTSESGNTITIYHTNQPFVGGIQSPDDFDEIGSDLVNKFIAALRTFPDIEPVITEMDAFIQDLQQLAMLTDLDGFRLLKPSMQTFLHSKWSYFSKAVLARLDLASINRHVQQHAHERLSWHGQDASDRLSSHHIEQVVETYLLKGLGREVQSWMARSLQAEHNAFLQSIECFRNVTQDGLDIQPCFQAGQTRAIERLLTVRDRNTPVDKLIVLKETIQLIQEAITEYVDVQLAMMRASGGREKDLKHLEEKELATDDLVAALIFVIVQAMQRDPVVHFDLMFCQRFHFAVASTSPIAYTTCHYEVALDWLGQPQNLTRVRLGSFSADPTSTSSAGAGASVAVELEESGKKASFVSAISSSRSAVDDSVDDEDNNHNAGSARSAETFDGMTSVALH